MTGPGEVGPIAVDDGVLELVMAAKDPIGNLGGWWMTSDEEEAATVAAGLRDWQLYFLGRHGVLGDVDPGVVVAAAYVFPDDHLRREWQAARRTLTPGEAVDRYVSVCHEWGRAYLTDFAGSASLSDLAKKVIDAVDVVGLPLFAGWRALPTPPDAPARCAHAMQLLREHRGSCHGVALVALQMPPLMAVLSNQGGSANAEEYGWRSPFPVVTEADRALRAEVELLTDTLVAPAYGVLTPPERAELLELLTAAAAHVASQRSD